MEKKEFEESLKKTVSGYIAPDGKSILRTKAIEAIASLKVVINSLADAVLKQAKEEAEKAQKELEELQNLKV